MKNHNNPIPYISQNYILYKINWRDASYVEKIIICRQTIGLEYSSIKNITLKTA
jgi:hypothetical protein